MKIFISFIGQWVDLCLKVLLVTISSAFSHSVFQYLRQSVNSSNSSGTDHMGKVGTSDINRIDCISIVVTLSNISRHRSVRLLGHTSTLSAKTLRSLSSLKVSQYITQWGEFALNKISRSNGPLYFAYREARATQRNFKRRTQVFPRKLPGLKVWEPWFRIKIS